MIPSPHLSTFFFFNDTATTEIYTLSLHDALPIYKFKAMNLESVMVIAEEVDENLYLASRNLKDRKSTRLNSSHSQISYAVFCLKKKKKKDKANISSNPQCAR